MLAESAGRPLRYVKNRTQGIVRYTSDDAIGRAIGGTLTAADQDEFVIGAAWARPLNILILLGARTTGRRGHPAADGLRAMSSMPSIVRMGTGST